MARSFASALGSGYAALIFALSALSCPRADSEGDLRITRPSGAPSVTAALGAKSGALPISPFIYGRNNAFSHDPAQPLSQAEKTRIISSCLRFSRENQGNNATKYNWKLKLTSHPDWYNNVYGNDWDYVAASVQSGFPAVQAMFAFQLLGKAASNASHNFDDYAYNRSQWWSGVSQNLAGGGRPNGSGGDKASVEGDPGLYLADWSASDSAGILSHWFGSAPGNLGLSTGNFLYWSMDNEPDIWSGTHDDVMSAQCSGEAYMQRYFAVAKAARAAFPGVKLCGPVPCNEWQWYDYRAWGGLGGLCWLEFFIKRVSEEERASGVKLLDMIDIHFYPDSSDPDQILAGHRVYFDRGYRYPGANGVKESGGGWDGAADREYVLGRCRDWLAKYGMGGVGVGVTETDVNTEDPRVLAPWYASCMGEFMKNSGEVFAPWSWKAGMWETLHLFARYNRSHYLPITESQDADVSLYPSVDPGSGKVSIATVNRSRSQWKTVSLDISASGAADGRFRFLLLRDLPQGRETFLSDSVNAIQEFEAVSSDREVRLGLPPGSVGVLLVE